MSAPPAAADPMADLMGLDDLLGGAGAPAASTHAPPPAGPPPLQLLPHPRLAPPQFQQLWEALPPAATFQTALQPAAVSATQSNHLVRPITCRYCIHVQHPLAGRFSCALGHEMCAIDGQYIF